MPLTHAPLARQREGHGSSAAAAPDAACAHVGPDQPRSHTHASGPTHRPWLEQPDAQIGTSHAAPLHPAAQRHAPGATQTPCPEHAAAHDGRAQSMPS